jgi:hypothetical protein
MGGNDVVARVGAFLSRENGTPSDATDAGGRALERDCSLSWAAIVRRVVTKKRFEMKGFSG